MAYDPHRPPPQWGTPAPYPPPPKGTGRIVAIIVVAVVGVTLLVPVLIGLAFFLPAFVWGTGEPVHREPVHRESTDRPPPDPATHQRVPADEHGPSFAVPTPGQWRLTTDRADPLLGHVRLGFEGYGERIAVTSYVEPETARPELALAKTVARLERLGYRTSGVPRTDVVGGEDALLQLLRVPGSRKAEVWVMVFVHEGARFVALYEGPPNSAAGARSLLTLLPDWRW